MMFARGGNAVDAACAMLAAAATMWDVLSWGGETQALIYLAAGSPETAAALAEGQYRAADNMTDRQGALMVLAVSPGSVRTMAYPPHVLRFRNIGPIGS